MDAAPLTVCPALYGELYPGAKCNHLRAPLNFIYSFIFPLIWLIQVCPRHILPFAHAATLNPRAPHSGVLQFPASALTPNHTESNLQAPEWQSLPGGHPDTTATASALPYFGIWGPAPVDEASELWSLHPRGGVYSGWDLPKRKPCTALFSNSQSSSHFKAFAEELWVCTMHSQLAESLGNWLGSFIPTGGLLVGAQNQSPMAEGG